MQRYARIVLTVFLVFPAAAFLLQRSAGARPENQRPGKYPEELVFTRTEDGIIAAGAIFTPPKAYAKPTAVIWIHGWGANFYFPTYIGIGRALAERGYTTISANTRMHDLGNVAGHRDGKRMRGGGYWGVASEEVRDLAAWIAFAETRGFSKVVLVGHSAGWSAVRHYQAMKQDSRVTGVVLASGAVRPPSGPMDPDQVSQAKRLAAEGQGDALVHDAKRSFPSYTSAATILDIANAPPEYLDFFGIKSPNGAVSRLRCPLLAFFGTDGDVGTQADLDLLKSSIKRHPTGPSRVDTLMIQNADHMYTGQESQVAEAIAKWIRR